MIITFYPTKGERAEVSAPIGAVMFLKDSKECRVREVGTGHFWSISEDEYKRIMCIVREYNKIKYSSVVELLDHFEWQAKSK